MSMVMLFHSLRDPKGLVNPLSLWPLFSAIRHLSMDSIVNCCKEFAVSSQHLECPENPVENPKGLVRTSIGKKADGDDSNPPEVGMESKDQGSEQLETCSSSKDGSIMDEALCTNAGLAQSKTKPDKTPPLRVAGDAHYSDSSVTSCIPMDRFAHHASPSKDINLELCNTRCSPSNLAAINSDVPKATFLGNDRKIQK
ncbi:hypothetical protein Nepgr_019639 [Nepenthes gracilis]|uniref:Uncharacterized protein n=1 Tax=Nepenthes gracilis TaxID=150966 RepID=A0AAD3SUE6_NEPGR|nr:hypothetical protein Nepgr_019639 [Nepenthes gracilis]